MDQVFWERQLGVTEELTRHLQSGKIIEARRESKWLDLRTMRFGPYFFTFGITEIDRENGEVIEVGIHKDFHYPVLRATSRDGKTLVEESFANVTKIILLMNEKKIIWERGIGSPIKPWSSRIS